MLWAGGGRSARMAFLGSETLMLQPQEYLHLL